MEKDSRCSHSIEQLKNNRKTVGNHNGLPYMTPAQNDLDISL